jgi:hypothetical protein
MENLHLKNIDQYSHIKTSKQAQSLLLYNLLQIFDNNLQIAYITKYIKAELFKKAFPNITYDNENVTEENIEYIITPMQLYLYELIEQEKHFKIDRKEKLNKILNEYEAIEYALINNEFITYKDVYGYTIKANNKMLKNTTRQYYSYIKCCYCYLPFEYWIYMDSVQEIINNKFKIIKHFIPRDIYIELLRKETNKISAICQNISTYTQEDIIRTAYNNNTKVNNKRFV